MPIASKRSGLLTVSFEKACECEMICNWVPRLLQTTVLTAIQFFCTLGFLLERQTYWTAFANAPCLFYTSRSASDTCRSMRLTWGILGDQCAECKTNIVLVGWISVTKWVSVELHATKNDARIQCRNNLTLSTKQMHVWTCHTGKRHTTSLLQRSIKWVQ